MPSSSEAELARRAASSPARSYSYDRVAWCYESIASVGSMGAIPAAKASQIAELSPGDRVLYAGVGSGEDALLAARSGAAVTGVDVSGRMLGRLEGRLAREGLRAELRRESCLAHRVDAPYDVVVANFFLNVFGESEVEGVLAHLVSLLRPGGKLMIADFVSPGEPAASRPWVSAYYAPICVAAWLLGLCALHPIYDYTRYFERRGLALTRRQLFRPLGRGPVLFESLVAVRARRS